MKKFKFLPPYLSEGKTTFPTAQNRSGVYLIKENGKIVYIGKSGNNLYRTLYRHFERWTAKYYVVTYKEEMWRNNYTVRIVFCTSNQADRLEKYLIKRHDPRDNSDMHKDFEIDHKTEIVADIYWKTQALTEAPF